MLPRQVSLCLEELGVTLKIASVPSPTHYLALSLTFSPDPAEVFKDITLTTAGEPTNVTASCLLPWACLTKADFDVSLW